MSNLVLKMLFTFSLFGSMFGFHCSNQKIFPRSRNKVSSFITQTTRKRIFKSHDVTSMYATTNNDSPDFTFQNMDDDDIGDEDVENDWRAFRARLVAMEHDQELQNKEIFQDDDFVLQMEIDQCNDTQARDLEPSVRFPKENTQRRFTKTWAFESGSIVERGTVLLFHPPNPTEEFGFGLGKQYLHKSAILILDHCESNSRDDFTKGVILNRPTDLYLDDVVTNPLTGEEKEVKWKIWFGGEAWGIHSKNPKFFCVHSLSKNKDALELSEPVLNGIYFTPFDHARHLVAIGRAVPSDFWIFSGVVPFKPRDLIEDIEDGIWHSVSTDARTLRKGLRILSAGGATSTDPRDAGVRTWSMLMEMIGINCDDDNNNGTEEHSRFDDLMLKAWANENLMFKDTKPNFLLETDDDDDDKPETSRNGEIILSVGSLVRSSSKQPKHLLSNQEFHKSITLIIQDDDNMTVGVILNRPSATSIEMNFKGGFLSGKHSSLEFPVRYGGPFDFNGIQEFEDENDPMFDNNEKENIPLFFLHMSPQLCNAEIGEPIGQKNKDDDDCRIWKCTMDEVVNAIHRKIADPNDFVAIDGFYVWKKSGANRGIYTEIQNGNFEVFKPSKLHMEALWRLLTRQEALNPDSMRKSLELSEAAWLLADIEECLEDDKKEYVFKSNVTISKLADIALETWVAAFLLGEPRLCPSFIDESSP